MTQSDTSLKYIFAVLFICVIVIHVVVYSDIASKSAKTIPDVAFGELLGFSLALTGLMLVLNLISKSPFGEDEK